MAGREYDLVIWGATGFTGQLATAALAGKSEAFFSCKLPNPGVARAGVRYALAGRDEAKLQRVRAECGCGPDVGVFVAESDNEQAIAAFVSRTRVVVAMAGPFKLYSDVVVAQCAKLGTHYVDITGEVPWVRSVIDRYDDVARSSGAIICNMCGFDSIPFDLGALFAINRLRAAKGCSSIRRIAAYTPALGGSFSGGSTATMVSNSRHPVQLTKGVDDASPFLLGGLPKGGARDEDTDASTHRLQMLGGDVPCGPSVMHAVNSRVVRRSAQLLGWGQHFNYVELSPVPSKKVAERMVKQQATPAPVEAVEMMIKLGKLPKPGEGPKPEARRAARFAAVIECVADDGERLVATMRGGEPGYEETARMVLEAGLVLAQEPHACPGLSRGGCLTPAAAMGETLIRRLAEVGMPFAVEPTDAAQVVRDIFRAYSRPAAKL
uniref:Saccharopine dehydrogenase NADP binding domain-containing protein n=1 Tax=Alexandrium catenella TaxID=2925 RepID=A0A7S1S878_ALECA|mmetsp:Transcript_89581/g.237921  ORF Transcript_89581/g.237921 Transcript_89581/m.237921 type:complete len:436 (+) Transcript_89581:81-1388(+)